MFEFTFSSEQIYKTIHQDNRPDLHVKEAQTMLNYDYLRMNPKDFNKLVSNLEQRNTNPVSEEQKRAYENYHEPESRLLRDTAQGSGDISVRRDWNGNVETIVLNYSPTWTYHLGADIVGTRIFDKNNPQMLELGRNPALYQGLADPVSSVVKNGSAPIE